MSRRKLADDRFSETGTCKTISKTNRNNESIAETQPGQQTARLKASQPILPQICEYSAGAEAEQRDGDCQEGEVIKQHDRK